MNFITIALAATLASAEPRPMTPNEARIWRTLSICDTRLKTCQFELREEKKLKESCERALVEPPPPPEPEQVVPLTFWFGVAMVAVAGFGTGYLIGRGLR